jgi:RNA polymerase sigma-70 factor (ECF subfamily)
MTGSPDLPDGDAAVIERSWAEPERFAAIFNRYFSEVHRYIARRIGPGVADDLVGEVFLAAFAQRRTYDTARGCARPWLYGIATNLIGAHRRQERRLLQAIARTGLPPAWQGDEEQLINRVTAAAVGPALADALMALAPGDRDALLLVALVDLSYPEVAAALDIPYGTVCSRLNRARRLVRDSLGGTNPVGGQERVASA